MENPGKRINLSIQTNSNRPSLSENMDLLQDEELMGFFSDEEFEGLIRELKVEGLKGHEEKTESGKNRISQILFDKSYFILKILKSSISKLNETDQKYLAKGLEWVTFSVHDCLLLKSDDKSLQRMEKMKTGNKEMESIFNWLEEYSTIKQKQKLDIDTVIQKKYNSNSIAEKSLDFTFSLESPKNTNLTHIKITGSNLLDFPEECIITIEEPTFDIFKLESEVGKENTLSTVSCYIFISLGLYSLINYNHFENFLQEITKGYSRKNPYHNDLHAADVEQTCFLYLKYGGAPEKLKLLDLDISAFLISAIIHDFKHPGYTNGFMINTKDEIAVRYNDQSVLENYHVAEAFKLIYSDEKFNIFSELSPEEFKLFKKRMIECVLATDMSFHTKQYTYIKAKKEKFSIKEGKNIENMFENLDNVALFQTQQDFLNILLHTADISNPTKPMHIYEQWVTKVMTEFWNQGDREKELKLPISFLCDRNTTSIPIAQMGFMDGIVFPLLNTVVDFFPGLRFLLDNCTHNKEFYKKLKQDEESLNLNLTGGVKK